MKRIITILLLIASFTLQAQTYKTVTMALDTPTNQAILRAGTQSLNLNTKYQSTLINGTNIKSINGTSLLGSGNYIIPLPDTTLLRTVANSLSLAQIQTALNLKANLSGATFTGDVQIPAIPINATSAASKSYIDNAITGITWKAAVRVATTANITLSGTQTIGAIALNVGDRVLVKNQTAQTENGIYIVSATAWTRSLDADTGLKIETATVAVTLGTVNANTQWTCTATSITIGTTPITFGQISGAGTYAAGSGLSLTGNVFAVDATVARLTGATFTGAVNGTSLTLSGAGTVGGNLAVTGTTTVTGGTRLNGLLGLNTPASSVYGIDNRTTVTSVTSGGNFNFVTAASTVTNFRNFWSQPIMATGGTQSELTHFFATQGSMNSVVPINQNGFFVSNTLTSGTNNYAFRSDLPAGTNRWNLYMGGTASNMLLGTTLIGGLTDNGVDKLQVIGSASISTNLQALNIGAGIAPSTSTRLLLAPATVSISSLRIPTGVAPTTPVDGDFWRLTGRTQIYDGTQTKDVIFDKANAVFAGFGVGVIGTDNLGNLAVLPAADRTTANTQNKSASYTVVLSDFGANGILYVRADASAGNMTITLPTALVMAGLEINVKKIDATANTVTISGSSIDGVTTKVLSGLNVFTSIVSNSTVFSIVGDKATGTGWASYSDGLYTLASPLSIAPGVTVTVTNNAATSIKSQLPVGVTDFYNSATSKITPGSVGDGYGISIRFKAKSTSSSDFFDFGIDIGGTQGVIFKQTRTFIKGANTEVGFDISINAFSLATFIANGGLVKITAGNGTMSVYSIVYDIFRTHKAL